MSKRHNAKYKIDRRLGVNLWGRAKSPYNKRTTRPGQHGAKPRSISDYGKQLIAKQKLKGYYGNISEKQFRRYAQSAVNTKGDPTNNFIINLERRLDAIVYRMKFVPTVFAARQFVNHGHVTVNGKKVNIPSYAVKVGDVIEVKNESKNLALVLSALIDAERDVPTYLDVDVQNAKGTVVSFPNKEDAPYPFISEPEVVIAFYSR